MKKTPINHKKSISIFVATALNIFPIHPHAHSLDADIGAWMEKNKNECLLQASVLADARWSKWQKSSKFSPGQLTDNDYKTAIKIAQQQCISVRNVVMLRQLKSRVSSEEAVKIEVDKSIEEQMLIIEKTL